MSNLKEIATNYGKLFYVITHLAKTKRITKDERVKLKGSLPPPSILSRAHDSGE